MKVAVDATAFSEQPSGARTRMVELYSRLARFPDIDLTFILNPGTTIGPLLQEAGVQSVTLPRKRSAGSRSSSALNPLAKLADTPGRFDLYAAESLPLPRVKSIPMVVTVHDLRFRHLKFTSLLRWLYARFFLGNNLLRARAVVTVSRAIKEEMLAAFPQWDEEMIHVVANGVPAVPRLSTKDADALCETLQVSPPYMLCISHIEPRKNIHNLLYAFGELKKNHAGTESCSLVLGGAAQQGITGQKVKNWCEQSGLMLGKDIFLPGTLSDSQRSALLKGASLVVQPSLYEGFGLGVLEAMDQGVPVACSAIPAHEEVAVDGAIYFPPSAPTMMAHVFNQALFNDSLRHDLVTTARKQSKKFSWDRSAEQIGALWKQMAVH